MKKVILTVLSVVCDRYRIACSWSGETWPLLARRHRTFSRARYRRLARRALVSRMAWQSDRLVVDCGSLMVLVSDPGLSLSKPLYSSGSCPGSPFASYSTPGLASNLVLLRSARWLLSLCS